MILVPLLNPKFAIGFPRHWRANFGFGALGTKPPTIALRACDKYQWPDLCSFAAQAHFIGMRHNGAPPWIARVRPGQVLNA